jgi:hypothetical protein
MSSATVPHPVSVPKFSSTQQNAIPESSAPPIDHSSSTIPSSVGSAPPMSSVSNDASHSGGEQVPTWLYGMAVGTFLLLIVLAIWWLSPTLMASRQLQNRLKGLERTRDER